MRHAFVFSGSGSRRRAERLQAAIREHGQPGKKHVGRLYAFPHMHALRLASTATAAAAQRPWFVWRAEAEYRRQGVLPSKLWRLSTANRDYRLCGSYPAVLLAPASVSDQQLARSSAYRGKGRLPSLCWRHPTNGASLIRCAQPRAGLTGDRCAEDELLVGRILVTPGARVPASQLLLQQLQGENGVANTTTSSASTSHLSVVDARDPASAIANRVFRGAGHEDAEGGYDARLLFLGVPNMHAVASVCFQ
jgi:myotubularin-related protein 6/7/8